MILALYSLTSVLLAATEPKLEGPPEGLSQERVFEETLKKDFPLRSLDALRVSNRWGNISVRGWTQDKIRVLLTRRVKSNLKSKSKEILKVTGVRFKETSDGVELSPRFGEGLDIGEKLKKRRTTGLQMDLDILAPADLPLHIWGIRSDVSVQKWNSDIQLRLHSGNVELARVKAHQLNLVCLACNWDLSEIRASIRLIGGSGIARMKDVLGKDVFVETQDGNQVLEQVQASQLYVSRGGYIQANRLQGKIEFRSQNGRVRMSRTDGFVSGQTDDGDILIEMRGWKPLDKAFIESQTGNIQLTLPSQFSAEVDLWSEAQEPKIEFPVHTGKRKRPSLRPKNVQVDSKPELRKKGRVGDGGETFKVYSQAGTIKVLRGL